MLAIQEKTFPLIFTATHLKSDIMNEQPTIQPTPKFEVGQRVTFVNDYGVSFPHRTITGIHIYPRPHVPVGYDVTPTDTPWYPIAERNLYLECDNTVYVPLGEDERDDIIASLETLDGILKMWPKFASVLLAYGIDEDMICEFEEACVTNEYVKERLEHASDYLRSFFPDEVTT